MIRPSESDEAMICSHNRHEAVSTGKLQLKAWLCRIKRKRSARAGSSRFASTLKDGLDALELGICDLLAAKEKRQLTSDLRHLPEDCEQLVEAAARLASESRVELSEWDARVDETARKVVVIHADTLLWLLAAIVSARGTMVGTWSSIRSL